PVLPRPCPCENRRVCRRFSCVLDAEALPCAQAAARGAAQRRPATLRRFARKRRSVPENTGTARISGKKAPPAMPEAQQVFGNPAGQTTACAKASKNSGQAQAPHPHSTSPSTSSCNESPFFK